MCIIQESYKGFEWTVWKQVVFRVYFSTETSHRWIEKHVIELTLTVHGETGKARRISGSAVTGCREFTVESRTAESMLGTKRKSALLSQLNSRPLCSQLFTVTVSCNAAPWRKNWVLKQTLHYFKLKIARHRTHSWLSVSAVRFLLTTAFTACKTRRWS